MKKAFLEHIGSMDIKVVHKRDGPEPIRQTRKICECGHEQEVPVYLAGTIVPLDQRSLKCRGCGKRLAVEFERPVRGELVEEREREQEQAAAARRVTKEDDPVGQFQTIQKAAAAAVSKSDPVAAGQVRAALVEAVQMRCNLTKSQAVLELSGDGDSVVTDGERAAYRTLATVRKRSEITARALSGEYGTVLSRSHLRKSVLDPVVSKEQAFAKWLGSDDSRRWQQLHYHRDRDLPVSEFLKRHGNTDAGRLLAEARRVLGR